MIDACFQKIIQYCKRKQAEGKKELSLPDYLFLWQCTRKIRKTLNPCCQRCGPPDFRTRLCRECRDKGKDIESCRVAADIEALIRDYIFDNA